MSRDIIKFAIALFIVSLTSVAYAGYDVDNPPDLLCQTGGRSGNSLAFGGKPISLFSGMETYAPSTDLTLGRLHPITITRSYNSITTYDSPLGYGWALNYDKRLYTFADNSVTLRRECGGKLRFQWFGPGFVGTTGDSGSLIQNIDGTFTYTSMSGEKDNYDIQGRLQSSVDAKGNSLVFIYRSTVPEFLWGLLPSNLDQTTSHIIAYDYKLSRIQEQDVSGNFTGNAVDLHYDTSTGRLTDIVDNLGRTVSYGHDGIGNLTSVSGPSTNSTYGYTDPISNHLLTSIDDGQGTYVNTYDPATGRVTRQTHGTGIIDFEYTIPLAKTKMTKTIEDSAGNVLNTQTRTAEFDVNGTLVKVTDTFGNITNYYRDSNTTWILQEGHFDISTGITTTTAYTYDSAGNILTKTEALATAVQKTTTYTYDPVYNLATTETVSSVVNPNLVSTITNSYDPASGNLLSRVDSGYLGDGTPYSYTTTYTYYPTGQLQSINGPRTDVSNVTTYTYDPTTGAIASITQPSIGSTTYSNFDSLGNPQTVTDPNGNATTYTYDAIGRVLTVKAPGDANPTQYFYVAGGCTSCGGVNKIDHITLPEGNAIWYTYDSMGNLSTIKDSLNNTINYTYDSEGNKLTEQINDANGTLQKILSYQYDALNRLAKIINPDATYTQYGYDGYGNRTSAMNPNSNTTSYQYDALNRLAVVTQPGTVTTTYGYDTNNNLTSVKDTNNNTTTYKYDDKGRVYQTISPDTGTTSFSYDPAG